MFRTSRQLADHELRLASLALAVAELREQRERSTPAEVFKLIEALQADIDAIRISLRSLHGKVAIQKRGQVVGESPAGGRVDASTGDDEFEALMALQRGFTNGGDH